MHYISSKKKFLQNLKHLYIYIYIVQLENLIYCINYTVLETPKGWLSGF